MYSQVAVTALRDLQQQLAASEQHAAELRKQVDDVRDETKAVQRNAEQDVAQHELERSQLRQLVIELKDELQHAVRDQDHSQDCNNSLRRELTAAHNELSSVKASNATLEDTMSLRLTDIRQLEQEKSSCHSTIRDLTSRTEALEEKLEASKDEVRQAESRAADAFMAREELQSALRIAQTETRTVEDRLAALQRTSEAAAAELRNAQSELDESKRESQELRDALETMREELSAVYARAHSAEVSAASAAAAASAPAAALHTATERMKQEVAVVHALSLRGVNAEGTLEACEAALLRGLQSISRVAEAYETLKPQAPHSRPSTPFHAKENRPDAYQRSSSCDTALAPLQDTSNRGVAAPLPPALLHRPGSSPGCHFPSEAPCSHLQDTHLATCAAMQKSCSACSSPLPGPCSTAAEQPDACIPRTHDSQASVAPAVIAAVHGSELAPSESAPQMSTALPSKAPFQCMADMHAPLAPTDPPSTGTSPPETPPMHVGQPPTPGTGAPGVAPWFSQWFHESFSNAHASLATIAMPHMHASISTQSPGVTLLAAHSSNETACSCPPQPPSVPPSPHAPSENPHMILLAKSGDSCNGNSSRGTSPSPELLRPQQPQAPQPPPHPAARRSCHSGAVDSTPPEATAAPAHQEPETASKRINCAGNVAVHSSCLGTDDSKGHAAHTVWPTAATDACNHTHDRGCHNCSTATPAVLVQPYEEQSQQRTNSRHSALSSVCPKSHPCGVSGVTGPQAQVAVSAAAEAPPLQPHRTSSPAFGAAIPDQATLSTYHHRDLENSTSQVPADPSSRAEGSRSFSVRSSGCGRSSRATSPTLRDLPDDSMHASEGRSVWLQGERLQQHASIFSDASGCLPEGSTHWTRSGQRDKLRMHDRNVSWDDAAQMSSTPSHWIGHKASNSCAEEHAPNSSGASHGPGSRLKTTTATQRAKSPSHCMPEHSTEYQGCVQRGMIASAVARAADVDGSFEQVDMRPQPGSPESPRQGVPLENSSVFSADEWNAGEGPEEPSAETMGEESSASLAGYCRAADTVDPPAVHEFPSSSSVSEYTPFSGSASRPPGHLRTATASRTRTAATPPPLPPPRSAPRIPSTTGHLRRRQISNSCATSVPKSEPRSASSKHAVQRSVARAPKLKTSVIPIRSTRASRGHSKSTAAPPVATPKSCKVSRGSSAVRLQAAARSSTGVECSLATPGSPRVSTPLHTPRSRRSMGNSPGGRASSDAGLAERMAQLRSDLSRQDLQHDALLRQIAACHDSRERSKFQGELKLLREAMIHTGQQLMAINSSLS